MIEWELSSFGLLCNDSFSYEGQVMGLGLFFIDEPRDDYINVEEVVRFHLKYNF